MLPVHVGTVDAVLLHGGGSGIIPRGTRVEVFSRIFDVFLVLGTLVGVVVIGYMSMKAYQYRRGGGHVEDDVDRPVLGEIPSGSGGGGKLFVSFGMSAVIVVSLIAWTYGTLLFVEQSTPAAESTEGDPDALEIRVVGQQFSWTYVYPNGHRSDVLRAPRDTDVHLVVTSNDVFHNFGIPELRVKVDAIPGQTTDTWFVAEETGTYEAHCYELCGAGHSYMNSEVVIMEQAAFEEWYASTSPADADESNSADTNASNQTASIATGVGIDTVGALQSGTATAATGVGA